MWKLWVKCSVLSAILMVIHAGNLGYGKWDLVAINKCEEEYHKFKFDLKPIKYNDTHQGFYGEIVAEEPFTEEIGIRIEIWKYKEEEWKKFQMLYDDSLYGFFTKFSEQSMQTFCDAAGIDSTKLPIEKGVYKIKDCVFPNIPTVGVNGTYKIMTFMVDGNKDLSCVETLMNFKNDKSDDDCKE